MGPIRSAVHLYGYVIGDHVSSGPNGDVYFAVRERDGAAVVLKACPIPPEGFSRARREFELLRRVQSNRVPQAFELEQVEGAEVLVLERLRGVNLAEYAGKDRLELSIFLTLATQCSEVLADVHQARIVHKDIKPHNLLVDPETLEVRVIDFGISALLGETRGARGERVEGTLGYIAPEQTGRVEHGVDFRSDLYSLGATLYELLTARAVFQSGTADELLYAHVAQIPTPPRELRPDVPETLSRIVLQLLEKDPESRYQTARGLRADLLECSKQLIRTGGIDPQMVLGSQDVPDRLRFPRRLYGRERQVAKLTERYARVRAGRREIVVIAGPAGIGKSALTEAVRVSLAEDGGHFVRGGFDRYGHGRAYGGFIDAFESLLDQLLTLSHEHLEEVRAELRGALGDVAPTLGEILPSLQLLLPDLPEPPRLSAKDRRTQLAMGAQRMIHTLATREHPMALVLDDLQWSDAGSRMLLEELLTDSNESALLLLITHRALSLEQTPGLAACLESQERAGRLTWMELGPLGDEDVMAFLQDVLGRRREDLAWLSSRVIMRTGSSPLLLHDFLLQLQDLGALQLSSEGVWLWDRDAVDSAAMSDQAVTFATGKISRLSDSARQLLEGASCIGDVFEPELLMQVVGADRLTGFQDLMTLATECLITPCRNGFRFVHDRIREAGLERLSSEERAALHGAIGRQLLGATERSAVRREATRIADHLNRAGPPLDDEDRAQRIQMNILATRQSLAANASADAYLRAGRALLRESDWETHPKLAFDLHLGIVQNAVVVGSPEQAERHLTFLESLPLKLVDRARVAAQRVEIRTTTLGAQTGVECGLRALRDLGVSVPESPSRLRIWWLVLRTRWLLRSSSCRVEPSPGGSGHRAEQPSEEWLAEALLISAISPGAFRENIDLLLVLLCRLIQGSLAHGRAARPMAVGTFAHLQAAITGDYKTAVFLAEVALEGARHAESPTEHVNVTHGVYLMVYGWTQPRRPLVSKMERVASEAFELGAREIGLYAQFWRAMLLLLVGEPLSMVERELRLRLQQARRISPTGWALRIGVLKKLQLLTGSPDPTSTTTAGLGEVRPGEIPAEAQALLAGARHHRNLTGTVELMALYLLGRYEEALECSAPLEQTMVRAGGATPHVSEFVLYRGLTGAALGRSVRGALRRRARRALAESTRRMKGFARHGPASFSHQALLLQAEQARQRGRRRRARRLYEAAARDAEANRYPHHLAIVRERLAGLLREMRCTAEASGIECQAMAGYRAWGALAKVRSGAAEAASPLQRL